jgi:hypothetical protein
MNCLLSGVESRFLLWRVPMQRFCVVVTGLVLALSCAGCGDSAPDQGPVEWRNTPPPDAVLKLRDQMAKNAKGGTSPTKPATDAKAPETKTPDKKN